MQWWQAVPAQAAVLARPPPGERATQCFPAAQAAAAQGQARAAQAAAAKMAVAVTSPPLDSAAPWAGWPPAGATRSTAQISTTCVSCHTT